MSLDKPRGLHANYSHDSGASFRGRYRAQLDHEDRRMFNEFTIREKASHSFGSAKGYNVGDDIKIYKKNPDSNFYDYGNKKSW